MQQPPDGDGRNANNFSVFLPAARSPAGLTKGLCRRHRNFYSVVGVIRFRESGSCRVTVFARAEEAEEGR